MARIDEYLQKILSARYGEEVRGAIHDSIDEINRVNEANISTVQAIADTAQGYADDAEDSKDLAAQSVTDAQAQVTLAQQQVTLATTQATNSANSAEDSEAWAVGQRSGIDVPSSDETYQNNSKYWQERANYWYQQAQSIAESFSGALRPMGTVTFENLPPLAQADSGDMYNISNQFTTTSDFVEGAGIVVPLGSNVYKTTDGKWDILAGSPVTGVKGNSESSYRRGNVNITKSNIGLGNVDNTSDANKPISTAQQAALDLKQNITDNSLTTTNKTIPGAINEINNDLTNKIDNFIYKETFNINESGLYDVYAIGPAANYATHYTVINHVFNSGFITQSILSLSKATLYSRTCFNGAWSDFLIVPNMEYLNMLTAVSTDSTKGTLVHFDDTKGKAFMLIDGQPWYFSVSQT